ncbi:MAG: precorrin-8X methylmutase [Thiothrix lacustris]|uniref:Precorrin-8X methylmutase n=1 Tax=Thiothrix lacustris TaxID=525917 RepID=A0A1Y1QW79_9GAMM|nr:MAG: precorrin-8X methylmutase [Thiothrix lacustris]
MIDYLRDPERIREQNYVRLREQAELSVFTPEQQHVVMQMVLAYGDPELAKHIRFSENALSVAKKAIKQRNNLLYDTELVKHALQESLLYQEPLGFMGRASVISQAKSTKQTRAMTAVDCWKPYMSGGIVLIGQSATALLHLVELLQEGVRPPALVIAAPRGFVNATEAKKLLWKQHRELGVECIVVDGTRGGGVLAAAALNALLMMQQGITV